MAPPRLLTRFDARHYLGGVDPEALGVAPVALAGRAVRFDRAALDARLDALAGLECPASLPNDMVSRESLDKETRSNAGSAPSSATPGALEKWFADGNPDPQRPPPSPLAQRQRR